MFYEEEMIDGVLCWRGTPDGPWVPFTPAKLSKRAIDLQSRISSLEAALKDAILKTGRTKSTCIEADPAGNSYEVDWLPEVKEWAALAGLDLEKHDPTWYAK